MIKKQTYIYFLFLAYFLQLGHSLFPHTHVEKQHHHNNHHTNHHHDHHHHNEDNQTEENSIAHFLSHFNHHSDTFSNTQLEDVSKVIKKVPNQVFVLQSTLVYTNPIGYYHKKEVVRNKEPLIFISPHLHSLQFRGPPTLFS